VKKLAVEISAHVIGHGREHIDVYEDWARTRDALAAETQNRTCHGNSTRRQGPGCVAVRDGSPGEVRGAGRALLLSALEVGALSG
jgi:hypothetical protein